MNNFFYSETKQPKQRRLEDKLNVFDKIVKFFKKNKLLIFLIITIVILTILIYKNNKLQKQIYYDHLKDLKFYNQLFDKKN